MRSMNPEELTDKVTQMIGDRRLAQEIIFLVSQNGWAAKQVVPEAESEISPDDIDFETAFRLSGRVGFGQKKRCGS